MRKYTIKRNNFLSRQPARARVSYQVISLSTVLSTTTGHIGLGITYGQSAAYPTPPYYLHDLWDQRLVHRHTGCEKLQ